MNRFIKAQENIYHTALAEIKSGKKQSHWMWFIFPQLKGLGRSSTARFYAIEDEAEATQYLNHPILGPRLIECTKAALAIEGKTVSDIFGYPDDMKFKSCMTLFAQVDAIPDSVFRKALAKYE